MRIDLHTHSSASDGTDSPAALVRAAKAARLDVVAITDHDTAAGWDEGLAEGERIGITVVPGIELSVTNGDRGQHLLAYLVDPQHPDLADMLRRAARSREDRIDRLFPLLEKLGMPVDEAAVRADAGGAVPSRKHVAPHLVRLGYVTSEGEAFSRWLNEGGEAYVERYRPDIVEAITAIRDAGGVSVIAHPRDTRRGPGVSDERLAELAARGLDGIEADHQMHTPDVRRDLRRVAADLGLVATGSSDHHGENKTDHELGCNVTEPGAARRLLGDAWLDWS